MNGPIDINTLLESLPPWSDAPGAEMVSAYLYSELSQQSTDTLQRLRRSCLDVQHGEPSQIIVIEVIDGLLACRGMDCD